MSQGKIDGEKIGAISKPAGIAKIEVMRNEVKAWKAEINRMNAIVNGQVTVEETRIKQIRRYPPWDM